MRSLTFLAFVIVTIFCWGTYGPVLHLGQEHMGADGKYSTLRPFICVGMAYFLIAVLFPTLVLMKKGEQGNWNTKGIIWSFSAGLVGAIGALGIILAFKFKGKPVFVMPLVFGCAPVVNTIVSMLFARTVKNASLLFYIGVLVVAVGAAGVLTFKPTKPKAAAAAAAVEKTDSTVETEGKSDSTSPAKSETNLPMVFASVLVTALCWGAYGPVLHKGQAKMGGSRLRPFLCVGFAYFTIAVIAPFALMPYFDDPGGWNWTGTGWSLLAGTVGAIGALGIIYAFNFGGKPIFIMPLVFGLAPVVNTFTETFSKGLFDQITWQFYASLLLVIFGAVTVLVCAPKGKPKPTKSKIS